MSFNFTGLLIMKFEGSKFEERYNTVWNIEAVPADNQIKKMLSSRGFFQFNAESCVHSIQQYGFAAKNIINNLLRQYNSFDDVEYVNGYLEATLNAIHSDFEKYRGALVQRVSADCSAVALIDQINRDLERSINEHRHPSASLSGLSDDAEMHCSSSSSSGSNDASSSSSELFVTFNLDDSSAELSTEYTLFGLGDDFNKESKHFELNDDDFTNYINTFSYK
jgi:superfamily II RNA helicase